MASGRLPFRGKSDVETLHAILAAEPAPLAEAGPGYPPEADRIVRKALEKEPASRYQHADELATDLRNLQRDVESGRVSGPTGTARSAAAAGGAPVVAGPPGRRLLMIAASSVLAVGLIAGSVYLYRSRGPAAGGSAPAAQARVLGVVGFENLTDPADSGNLGRMLMALISTDLGEGGGLSVISTPKMLSALKQAGQSEGKGFDAALAPEAARLAGADLILVGQVSQAGERLILTAELVEVGNGNRLGSVKREAGSKSELFSLAGSMAADVRKHLGPAGARGGSGAFELARALTRSPEAYNQYFAGEVAFQQGRFAEAIEQLRRAVREDPSFALAHYRLSMVLDWKGQHEEAVRVFEAGSAHAARLPARWQTLYAAWGEFLRGDLETSHATLTDLVRSSPDLPDAWALIGETVFHSSRLRNMRKAREAFERALDLDPTFREVFNHLIDLYIVGEDLDAAERQLARFEPTDPVVMAGRALLLAARGRDREAVALSEDLADRGVDVWFKVTDSYINAGMWERVFSRADRRVRENPQNGEAYAQRALVNIGKGRFRIALSDLQTAATLSAGEKSKLWPARSSPVYYVGIAEISLLTGDIEGAAGAARRAVEADPLAPFSYFCLGRILLEAGKKREADQVLTNLQEVSRELSAPTGSSSIHLLKAEQHLADGAPALASAELEQVSALAHEFRNRSEEWLARARIRLASGDRPGAISAYRECIASPRFLFSTTIRKVRAIHTLARLEEESGDIPSARQHYRQFLDRWGNADLPLAEVKDAKTRLAALESEKP
jgi:tetratricopeptide (TPR) repeat protein/TolB-like protein